MKPLKLIEPKPGSYSLVLKLGALPVDDEIRRAKHESNGDFWAGIAQLLIAHEAPAINGTFDFDPEAGMFCAYGSNRATLAQLGQLMAEVANKASRLNQLLTLAEQEGFTFDD
jgi:hypothetical protein